MQQVLIHQNLLKKVDSASSKSNVDKLDIDKSKNVRTNFSTLETKIDKLNVGKVVPVPVDLSKVSGMAKHILMKRKQPEKYKISIFYMHFFNYYGIIDSRYYLLIFDKISSKTVITISLHK